MERSIGDFYCDKCKRTVRAGLRRTIMVSGGIHVYRVCLATQIEHSIKVNNSLYVTHADALRWSGYPSIEDIQIGQDYSSTGCAVISCDRVGIENHHTAPRAVFGEDAENWPQVPLCRDHHIEWHTKMDGYRWKGKQEAAE